MNPITMTLVPLLHLTATLAAPTASVDLAALDFGTVRFGTQESAPQPAKMDASLWRYETGRRMRAMERAWAAADEARRGAVVRTIEKSVALFFRGSMAGVARELDAARRQLEAGEARATELERAGSAFAMVPSTRLVAAGTERLRVRIAPIYGDWDILKDASIALRYSDPVTDADYLIERPCGVNGAEVSLDLDGHSVGIFSVSGALKLGDVTVSIGTLRFEIVTNLGPRIAALKGKIGRRSKLPSTVAAQTAYQYLGLLEDLAEGKTPETDYPAGELLERAELLAQFPAGASGGASGGPAGAPSGTATAPGGAISPGAEPPKAAAWIASPGERWLSLPVGRRAVKVRVLVPEGMEPGARTPLVVALHGAGGSHNMFFDGYGDGLAVDLARARGWILIAPQVGFFGCPVVEIVDAIAAHLPVDAGQVFLLGHSMGAGAAIRAASGAPDRFRAMAVLGGGGKAAEAVAGIPAFLGAGASDFGKPGVDALAARLKALGAKGLVHRTYRDTEHLLIVQRALPDVYAFFDAHLGEGAEGGR